VCGTDFSLQAAQAVEAAAALAKRLDEPLVLVHAIDKDSRAALPADVRQSLCLYERAQLHEELERVREAKVEVVEHFGAGKPDAVLVEAAEAQYARLLVVSSHGRKPPGRWVLGSVAERVAEASPVPTLVVRSAAPFVAWTAGKRRLRVFVGADFSVQSEAALRWVAWLRQLGRCDVVVAHLEPTLPTNGPFDMYPSPAVAEMLDRTEQVQARSFRQRVRAVLGASRVRVRIEKGWNRSDAHLIQVAREERADLIVVGTHQRHGLGRIGHLSVSRGVLHYAPMSVVCVPTSAALEQTPNENHVH
jgi:nucleotide-binding universal stress UspA family protein